jgi:UDP-3-O-[3-hydroxymyristoyl] glucosamine N-acyltransferase
MRMEGLPHTPPTSHPIAVQEIADYLGAERIGDGAVEIRRIASLETAEPGDLSLVGDERFVARARDSRASALLVTHSLSVNASATRLIVRDAYAACQQVYALLHPVRERFEPGIDATACVDARATLGDRVHVGPGATIGAGARIDAGTTIREGVRISAGVQIGAECHLYPNVVVRSGVKIGHRTIIQPGAVIGSDGYGFVRKGETHQKIPHLAGVTIGNDVEIGANTCIDRGTFDDTVIGDGTKIDNLVHIAHNVRIGQHALILAQVGISGSTVIGDRAVLAGQAGIADHIEIGAGAMVGAQAGVMGKVAETTTVLGTPAIGRVRFLRAFAHFKRLPDTETRIRALERQLDKLRRKLRTESV